MPTLEMSMQTWTPEGAAEHEIVNRELNTVLASTGFRNSKRYPALLSYVVERTLTGHTDQLKERAIGVAVFHRAPDYEPASDPVVRYNAGEVRRRLSSYYHEEGADANVQIYLPSGTYIPEFKRRQEMAAASVSAIPAMPVNSEPLAPSQVAEPLPDLQPVEESRSVFRPSVTLSVAVALACVIFFGVWWGFHSRPTNLTLLWRPLLGNKNSAIFVSGHIHEDYLPREGRPLITLENGVSIARISGLYEAHKKTYKVQVDSATTLSEMTGRPVVFLNAFNNAWTMRVLEPLRYHFSDVSDFTYIIDRENPGFKGWSIDWKKSPATAPSFTDYAIIARFNNASTGAPTMVLAGMGRDGTSTAAQFVTSEQLFDQLTRKMSRADLQKNVEIVLKMDVINGEAGPPSVIATYVW